MKKLIIIFGPHAVGKMTVGQELMKLTGIPLLHNHMTIEFARYLHGESSSDSYKKLNKDMRELIFQSVATGDNKGLIFTYMFALDEQSDKDYVSNLRKLFEDNGAESYLVELYANKDVRLERNVTENRLKNKPSKRLLDESKAGFEKIENMYRLNSYDGEFVEDNYIKIDNTNLSAEETAKKIVEHFKL